MLWSVLVPSCDEIRNQEQTQRQVIDDFQWGNILGDFLTTYSERMILRWLRWQH
jgi:hypothetical protein